MMQPVSVLAVIIFGSVVLVLVLLFPDQSSSDSEHTLQGTVAVADDGDLGAAQVDGDSEGQALYPIKIRHPDAAPLVELATSDAFGRPARVACSTCHGIRKPNFSNTKWTSLDEFHQGLEVDHGKLVCYACHNPDDADTLKSADGKKIPYPDVMTLCSQCHGTQALAYAHGAHGGMNGYWDLTRGPQLKNNCIDCHDPHRPRYPSMIVTFKPRDRFLDDETAHGDHE